MNETITATGLPPAFPDHTQLPDEDGTFVKNFHEHPQSIILADWMFWDLLAVMESKSAIVLRWL